MQLVPVCGYDYVIILKMTTQGRVVNLRRFLSRNVPGNVRQDERTRSPKLLFFFSVKQIMCHTRPSANIN